MTTESCLAVDVGTGTQDLIIYTPGLEVENSVQMVLPSPTALVAREIRGATRDGRDVALTGTLMGGGPCVRAVRDHLAAGLGVWATPSAALTVHDCMDVVRGLGIRVGEDAPAGAAVVRMGDLQLERLDPAFRALGIAAPGRFLVAALDHGHSPGESNRRFRFRTWERFLASGGEMDALLYRDSPPRELTRLGAIADTVPGTWTMDTGSAAVWGAVQDPVAGRMYRERGLTVVNVGNSHVLAALIHGGRVWGLFEHHSRMVDPARLVDMIAGLRAGTLTFDEVFDEGGHGAALAPSYRPDGRFEAVAVTGPLRGMLDGYGVHMAVPFGNMMLSGCYGLLAAAGVVSAPEGDDVRVPDKP